MKNALMMLLIATMGMFTTTSNAQSLPFLEAYVEGDGNRPKGPVELGDLIYKVPLPTEGRIDLGGDRRIPGGMTHTIIPARPKGQIGTQ